jgi:hypothetical protein
MEKVASASGSTALTIVDWAPYSIEPAVRIIKTADRRDFRLRRRKP